MAKITLKDVASIIGNDKVMTVKSHQRAMKQHRLAISQTKEVLDVARESIESKLPNHIGSKEVREINDYIRIIQSARAKLVELKNKIRCSELVCKAIFLDAANVLEQRKARALKAQTIRKEIPTHSREDWQSFLRRKSAEIKAKKEAEKKQYTEKRKTQTNAPIEQELSDKEVERATLGLVNLLNLVNQFSARAENIARPRSSRSELENLLREFRGF